MSGTESAEITKGIFLENVRYINWYGFRDVTIPFDWDSTLLAGLNESGKSTAVDGISISEFGDRKTNASSGAGSSSRKYVTYTRCLVNADPVEYARPKDKYPVVYSHVATEWYDAEKGVYFINDTMYETVDMEVQLYRMCIEGKRLEEVSFFAVTSEGKKRLYGPDEFCRVNGGLTKMAPKEGLDKFFQRKGLRIGSMEQRSFIKKLRNLKSYNPEESIETFIKTTVLEPEPVNIDKIRKAQESYKETEKNWNDINRQVSLLTNVTEAYEQYKTSLYRYEKAEIKRKYKEYIDDCRARNAAEESVKSADDQLKALDAERKLKTEQRENVSMKLFEENARLEGTGFAASIKTQQEIVRKLEDRLQLAKEDVRRLESCRQDASDMAELMDNLPETERSVLRDITDDKTDASVKLAAIRAAGRYAADEYKRLNAIEGPIAALSADLINIRDKKRETDNRISEIDRHAFVPEQARNAEKLKGLINKELKRHGMKGEAKLIYECVLGIKDESWREIIEALLWDRRFSVVVPLECYDVAYYVQSRNDVRRARLVRSDFFSGRRVFSDEDERNLCLASQLDVPMEIARNYLDYYLNYRMVDNPDDVGRYPRAIAKNGFMGRPEATEYVYIRKDLRFCLGADALMITRRRLEDELLLIGKEYESKEHELIGLRDSAEKMRLAESTAERLLRGNFNFDAAKEHKRLEREIGAERKELESLISRSERDPEFAEIKHRVDYLEGERNRLDGELVSISTKERDQAGIKTAAELEIVRLTENIDGTDEVKGHKEILDELWESKPSEYEDAIAEYDRFLQKGNRNDNVVSDSHLKTYLRNADDDALFLREQQKAYADSGSPLPFGSTKEVMDYYYDKKRSLEVKDSEEAMESLRNKQRERLTVFQNDFFVRIRNKVRDAMTLKRELNRDLKNVKFSTTYQFEFSEKKDGTLYERILRCGEYFCNNVSPKALTSNQVMLSDLSDDLEGQDDRVTESELNELIDELLECKDFEAYEDYRNYMVYDVRLEGPGYGEKGARLTKQNGYNSGAGCQIPYAVILSCGLSAFYNRYDNASRLVMIDEPFEKLDSANVKTMLNFFRSCGFQMIFASGNRSFDIGQDCRMLVSVSGKGHKDDMTIGDIKMLGECNES